LENRKPDEEIREEDIKDALKEIGGTVDITVADLKKIFQIVRKLQEEKAPTRIRVSKIMTKAVVSITREADLATASRKLSENRISGMPVIDPAGRVLGVISEGDILSAAGMGEHHTFKDILRKVLGEPVAKSKTASTVGDSMSSPAITISQDSEVSEAARVMSQKRIKRLPVVDSQNNVVGIVTKADIVKLIGKH
jgi:CBS domain-containing protein